VANKIEEICVSLETAKRLQEAGIVIDAIFYWAKLTGRDFQSDWHIIGHDEMVNISFGKYAIETYQFYPAPTADEFEWDVLPDLLSIDGVTYFIKITKAVNHWRVNYWRDDWDVVDLISYDKLGDLFPVNDHKLCEVMASVAIWLKHDLSGQNDVKSEG